MRILSIFMLAALLTICPTLASAERHYEISMRVLYPGLSNPPRTAHIFSDNAEAHEIVFEADSPPTTWGSSVRRFLAAPRTQYFNNPDLLPIGFEANNTENGVLTPGQYQSNHLLSQSIPGEPIRVTMNDQAILKHFTGIDFPNSDVRVDRNILIAANAHTNNKVLFSGYVHTTYWSANFTHLLSVAVEVNYQDGFAAEEELQIEALEQDKLTLQNQINELSGTLIDQERTIENLNKQLQQSQKNPNVTPNVGSNQTPTTAQDDNTYNSAREIRAEIRSLNAQIKKLKKLLLGFRK